MSEDPGEVDTDEEWDVPLDTALDLLAARPRRALLYRLAADGVVPIEELTTALLEVSEDDDRRRAETTLTHVHLPRLVDSGVVSVEDGEVRYRPSPTLESSLTWARRLEREDVVQVVEAETASTAEDD